jgi:hypothetical protein
VHDAARLLCISSVSGNKIVAAALLRHAQRSARLPCSTPTAVGGGVALKPHACRRISRQSAASRALAAETRRHRSWSGEGAAKGGEGVQGRRRVVKVRIALPCRASQRAATAGARSPQTGNGVAAAQLRPCHCRCQKQSYVCLSPHPCFVVLQGRAHEKHEAICAFQRVTVRAPGAGSLSTTCPTQSVSLRFDAFNIYVHGATRHSEHAPPRERSALQAD